MGLQEIHHEYVENSELWNANLGGGSEGSGLSADTVVNMTSGGFSSMKPGYTAYSTWVISQSAIDTLPKNLNSHTLTLYFPRTSSHHPSSSSYGNNNQSTTYIADSGTGCEGIKLHGFHNGVLALSGDSRTDVTYRPGYYGSEISLETAGCPTGSNSGTNISIYNCSAIIQIYNLRTNDSSNSRTNTKGISISKCSGSIYISSCMFGKHNTTSVWGNTYNSGIYIDQSSSTVYITSCKFWGMEYMVFAHKTGNINITGSIVPLMNNNTPNDWPANRFYVDGSIVFWDGTITPGHSNVTIPTTDFTTNGGQVYS